MPGSTGTNRNKIALIIIIIVCVTLVTLYVREGGSGPIHSVQGFFLDVLSPVASGLSKVFRPIKDGFLNLLSLPSLVGEKRELEKEVASLRRQVIQAERTSSELEEVKRLLKWAEESSTLDVVGADIVGQSPDNWQRLMIINRGSSHGVMKYMSVVTEEGLVGRVISVGSRSSVVQLITDSRSQIGGREIRTAETGIIEGRNESTLRFTPMDTEASLRVGDLVVTSGMGGTCPPDIPVGRVTRVTRRTRGLAKLVEIEPHVRFSRLDKVLVIITPEPESVILREEQ